jgi:hypothetical protein
MAQLLDVSPSFLVAWEVMEEGCPGAWRRWEGEGGGGAAHFDRLTDSGLTGLS